MTNTSRKTALEGFVTEPEIEDSSSLAHSRQQQLPEQYLAWRTSRQFDRESRRVPEIAAAVTESVMEGDRAVFPLDTGEPQPARVSCRAGQRLIEIAPCRIEKLARIGGIRPSGNVLSEEFSEMGTNGIAIREMPDLQGPLTPKVPFVSQQALLFRGLLAHLWTRGKVEARRGP